MASPNIKLEEVLKLCKATIIKNNYDSMSTIFDAMRDGMPVGRRFIRKHFLSYPNLLRVLRIPFCQMKGKFRARLDESSIKKTDCFSRRYGELKVKKVTRHPCGRFYHFDHGLNYDHGVLTIYGDLQTYTQVRLEIQEFKRVVVMVESSRSRAKIKKMQHSLSVYDIYKRYNFKLPQKCPVLGIKLDYYLNKFNSNSPSLDRIDSSKGYTADNVRIISYQANAWRSNMTKAQKLLILKDALDKDEEVIIRKKRV